MSAASTRLAGPRPRHPLLAAGWRQDGALLLLGALSIVSFAPFGWWPVQCLTLATLCFTLLQAPDATLWLHFRRGWMFGLGWGVAGMYWLFYTMHHYGHLPAVLSVGGVLLLGVLYLAMFPALALCASAWLRRRWQPGDTSTALLVFPACWALGEWMRGWMLTGVPWVVSGYAHTDAPLGGFAPIVGVYGIGALVALLGASLALLWTTWRRQPATLRPAHWLLPLLAVALLGSGQLLRTIAWSQPQGQPISVRLLQGNVSQESKFDRERLGNSLALYQHLIESGPADLIATPETALPMFIHQLPAGYLQQLQTYANSSHSHLALGLLVADNDSDYSNSLVGISPVSTAPATPNPAESRLETGPDSRSESQPDIASANALASAPSMYRYNKQHLVPFGEFVPWGLHWFVDMLGIPMSDQTRGQSWQMPWRVKDQWILPNICYEDLFGEEIAHHMAQSQQAGKPVASILLNVSNLAWFDDSLALPQHLQIAQMRALETARPMLRATNTGATAVVDYDGRIEQVLPFLVQGQIHTTVQGRQGSTPYLRFGNLIMLLCAGLALALARLRARLRRPRA